LNLCPTSIYSELADQYKILDAASNVAKRNVLAEHLREVIDTLEQKVRSASSTDRLFDPCADVWAPAF
jgi:hypothetical protein